MGNTSQSDRLAAEYCRRQLQSILTIAVDNRFPIEPYLKEAITIVSQLEKIYQEEEYSNAN